MPFHILTPGYYITVLDAIALFRNPISGAIALTAGMPPCRAAGTSDGEAVEPTILLAMPLSHKIHVLVRF